MLQHDDYLIQAIDLARANVDDGGRPFGALVVKDGAVLATGVNRIGATGDPTSHAELNAIRAAAQALGAPRLDGCIVYASGQPCPMCLAAIHMTGVSAVYFALSNEDGEAVGLSTTSVYAQMALPIDRQAIPVVHRPQREAGRGLYAAWVDRQVR